MQQLDTELLLQHPDLTAQRGLGEVQALRGAGEVAFAGDREEVAQAAQILHRRDATGARRPRRRRRGPRRRRSGRRPPGRRRGASRPRLASSARPCVERHADALDRGAAVGEHRLLGEGGQRLGHLERALEVAPGGHDLGQQAHRQRLLGWHHAAGEDQVERAAEADDARQPLGAAVDQRHAPAALGEAERGALGGDPQVAPQRQLEAAGEAPAGDRGDRGLRRRPAREAERAVRRRPGAGRTCRSPSGRRPRRRPRSPAPVRTITRASSSASKRWNASREQLGGRPVDGVAALLAVDREHGGGTAALVGHGLCGHPGCGPATSRRAGAAEPPSSRPCVLSRGPWMALPTTTTRTKKRPGRARRR